MSKRLDTERQERLQPLRMQDAKDMLTQLNLPITFEDETTIKFTFKGNAISYWPYSGWFSGKGVSSGRGIRLLNQRLKQ